MFALYLGRTARLTKRDIGALYCLFANLYTLVLNTYTHLMYIYCLRFIRRQFPLKCKCANRNNKSVRAYILISIWYPAFVYLSLRIPFLHIVYILFGV